MRQFIYAAVFCVLALGACTESFKKGDNGMEYKIISSGSGSTISYGDFMQMHIVQMYKGEKDTVLSDTREYKPRIELFDSISTPPAYFKILRQLRKGDSLVIRLVTDSIFKSDMNTMPPYMKKGKYVYTTVKLVNIFKTKEQADSAEKAEEIMAKPRIFKLQMDAIGKDLAVNQAQLDADSKTIDAHLAKNNLKAIKAKWGTYIVVHTEGTGEQINENHQVMVNYTGKTLDSSLVFDSNVDPKFQHVQPYMVNISQPQSIMYGWTDALMQLKKGSKVTLYIPSSLAYGTRGRAPMIKPNDILVFDLEVLDVMTEEQAMAKAQAEAAAQQQKLKEEEEKRIADMQKKK